MLLDLFTTLWRRSFFFFTFRATAGAEAAAHHQQKRNNSSSSKEAAQAKQKGEATDRLMAVRCGSSRRKGANKLSAFGDFQLDRNNNKRQKRERNQSTFTAQKICQVGLMDN
jgi:hypothetical protein